MSTWGRVLIASALAATAGAATANELNLYTSRHYATDEALYDDFTKATGIRIARIEASADKLIERIRAEDVNSKADLLITVDAGRLWRAQQLNLFQPVRSAALESAIPAQWRDPAGHWFGLSVRARVLVYAKDRVGPLDLKRYEDLADARWRGRLLSRSSTDIYVQSLIGSLIAHNGETATEAWARGVVANFARPPRGGDTDQIRAVAAGEGDLALVNTYYLANLARSKKPEDQAIAAKLAVVFPNQGDRGTHVNISGAGVARHAPNRANAVKFLEYLVSPSAQAYFADGNNEYPVLAEAKLSETLAGWGTFKADRLEAAIIGAHNEAALRLADRVGWK
ncbi:MAG: Fe(3+) ABC transporter substrate-binding protein [Alphaproteobacteria bacterium]|nr:Fe(3+) ABC transporter substrate-binding protein [Alphaproteobacteria bacterium]